MELGASTNAPLGNTANVHVNIPEQPDGRKMK